MFNFHHRGLATGIYTTNSAEACQYVAANCEANILVVENQKQLDKILQVGQVISLRILLAVAVNSFATINKTYPSSVVM